MYFPHLSKDCASSVIISLILAGRISEQIRNGNYTLYCSISNMASIFALRMPPPRVMGQPPRPAPPVSSSEASERPATVKSEDIQDMGDNSDDEGWAGAQEEVDYNVKLKFDESDEEPEPAQTASSSLKSAKDENNLLPSKVFPCGDFFNCRFINGARFVYLYYQDEREFGTKL